MPKDKELQLKTHRMRLSAEAAISDIDQRRFDALIKHRATELMDDVVCGKEDAIEDAILYLLDRARIQDLKT